MITLHETLVFEEISQAKEVQIVYILFIKFLVLEWTSDYITNISLK